MSDRYFVETHITEDAARLVGSEAHHLAHVMRAKPGAVVTLFDGSGLEFTAAVVRVGRAEIELEIHDRRHVDRELFRRLTLAVALPKGDRQRWLVEKATELGVARIVPLVTHRGNDRESPSALEKLRRAVIEASKQCGRNRLLEILAPVPWEMFLSEGIAGPGDSPASASESLRLIAHPGGAALPLPAELPHEVILAIGPEGGFTPGETEQALAASWQAIDLGARILRIETAALALAARFALC